MTSIPRRRFLQSTVAGAAGLWLAGPNWANSRAGFRPLGANDDLRIGVIGVRGRGSGLMTSFHGMEGARVVALCDVDRQILAMRAKWFDEQQAPVATYVDAREMLDNPDIDVVVIATPNHWHSLLTVWACMAGKDVYVEKPVSHNVWEGRQAVLAAERYDRIVQTGTQSRSAEGIQEAIRFLHEGNLGAIKVARGLCYKTRKSIGHVSGPQAVDKRIDYNLWCGPADMEPLRRKSLHYDWHWVWATGNGDVGNQGIHQMDIARWALGAKSLSKRIWSLGGRFGYVDDGETPNTQVAAHEFDEGLLIFEVRGLYDNNGNAATEGYRGIKIGNVIECEQGYVALDTSKGKAFDWDGGEIQTFRARPDTVRIHIRNFLDCVRSRKREDQASDILEGHLSSALCHTANISHLLGHRDEKGEIRTQMEPDSILSATLERFKQHLHDKGVELALEHPTIGSSLKMDPATESFPDQPMATMLLSRNYREPFQVPQIG